MLHGEYMVRISATHIDSARCGRPRRRAHARPVSPVTHHSHNISAGRSPGACAPGRERREPAGRGDTRGVRRDPRLPPRGATVSRTAERTDSDTRPAGQPARPNWLGLRLPPATSTATRSDGRATTVHVYLRVVIILLFIGELQHVMTQSVKVSYYHGPARALTPPPALRESGSAAPGLTASTEYSLPRPGARGPLNCRK